MRRAPIAAVLFGLAALSLAGIPPFSGFVGKLSLVEAGFGSQAYVIVGVSLLGSLLTLFSMAKIWNGVFWGKVEGPSISAPAVVPAGGGGVAVEVAAEPDHPGADPSDHDGRHHRAGGCHRRHRPVRRTHLRPGPPCR